ncbi:MAG TPA: alpha-2-macroglobulin family protein, partial [Anaerolineaceae bacterium]|nr:alpha-2-macroglobulin family protein [Anaerolineaceae bacterium]
TDANGKALIQIKLPDNLTSWVAVARGLTKDARVGEGRTELIASKDLIIRPSTPRFVVIGDHLQLAATVHNTSGRDLRGVKVSLDCAGIILDAQTPAMQTIDLPKDQTLRVYWGVTVENVEAINPVFTARLGDFSDSTLSPWGELIVYKNPYPYELRAHGMLDQAGEQWEVIPLPRYFVPEGGSVQVRLSLTPALETLSGLRMLKQNLDLKLTEPVISVLFPNVETYLALQNEAAKDPLLKLELEGAIQKSIDRLISLQRLSGGWGRTYFEAEDPYLSAYAVYALARAQEAGFTVNEVVYKKAYNFVSGRKASYNGKIADWRNNREAFILYVRSYIGVKNIAKEAEPFFLNRSKLEPWALAMLALVYHNEAPQGSEVGQLVQDLEDSISYQNDGVYWRAVAEHYEILGTDNFATAVALIALTQLDPGWGPLWEAATYLAGNTRSDGTWGSSYDTAWTIAALNRLVEKDIAEDFSYAADLNGVEFASAPSPATGTLALANYTVSLDQLDLKGMNVLHVERGAGMGRLFYSVLVALEQPIAQIQASTRGLKIERTYYVASRDCVKILCQPIQSISMAQNKDIMVRLTVYVPRKIYNVVVEDYIPAGTELINMSLASEVQVRTLGEDTNSDPWGNPFFDRNFWARSMGAPDLRDNLVRWNPLYLDAGTYEVLYYLRPTHPGTYNVIPARIYEQYNPDHMSSHTSGMLFSIEE